MIKGMVAWFAENHVAANLLMLFLLLAGVITGLNIKMEVFPDTSLDIITIATVYPGASPSEVEEAVIRRIEEKIAGLTGIKRIDSTAREGVGIVTVEVMKDWDLKSLMDEVKAEVDRITTFPGETEKPVVRQLTHSRQVINVAVYGDAPETTIKHLVEKLKDDITNLPGITHAELFGVRDYEIHIEIKEETLRRYGLTLGKVADAVRRGSLDLPAGSIKTSGDEILIRTKGRRYFAEDYRKIAVITKTDGSQVTLGQIAGLKDVFEDVDLFAYFQGKPAAMIQVYRVAGQNALAVADTVKQYIEKIRPSLPYGIGIAYFSDMAKILNSRISLLMKNLGIGLLLVSIMLALFLNYRLAFWVTLGIPISFAASLLFLPRFDISINMMSLFAFIMVLGIVVDDAIIVGENIFRKHEEGYDRLEGAIDGTLEVGRPVIFSVLTTIAAFSPLLLAGGVMGKMMYSLPIVVILVLFGSLVESLLILPAHLARSRTATILKKINRDKKKLPDRLMQWAIHVPYARLAAFCVKWRYATLGIAIAILLLAFGVWEGGWIKFTFFPKVESDWLQCYMTMPPGTPVEKTKSIVALLEQNAKQTLAQLDKNRPDNAESLFKYSFSVIGAHQRRRSSGSRGGHLAQIWIQLLESEKRDISTSKLIRLWRKKNAGLAADAESITYKSELHSGGTPIEVHLSLDEHDKLMIAADNLKRELNRYPGVFDVSDSYLPGKKEMQINLKPEAQSLGLTLHDLAAQVRHAFQGAEALRLQRDRDEVKVLVCYPQTERISLKNIEKMRIRTKEGDEVPFSLAAKVKMEQGYTEIQRAQRLRVIKVTADVDESITNANEVRSALENGFLPELKNNFPDLRYSIEGEGKEQKENLGDILRGFVIALFCIYALLAIPFKSFTQPFIVVTAIPFGLVGALGGHLLMGYNITNISLFGMVGLTGVVVNDSLVLIHAANRIRNQGVNARDAVTQAGGIRFRAIILTSLTTFAGLTPMLLERSIQAQFLIPMAVSLGFGVLFATGVTLLLVPCGYIILEDIHNSLAKIRSN